MKTGRSKAVVREAVRTNSKKKRPASGPRVRVHVTRSERGTFRLARKLASGFRGDEVVLLIGELGAGKTVFAKGIASGLGIKDVRRVCSPTFSLLNIYQARVPIWHLDLYRLGEEAEIRDLGFEDAIGEGVLLVEWAERIGSSVEGITVRIEVEPDGRRRIQIRRPNRRSTTAGLG